MTQLGHVGTAQQRKEHAEESMALTERGIREPFGTGDHLTWRCSDRPRALRGGHRRDAPGLLRFPRYRGDAATLFFCFLASGLGESDGPRKDFKWWRRDSLPSRRPGSRSASPYLHHVKGELLLAQNPSDVAEAELCFRTAIEIARRQSARSGVARHDEPRALAQQAGPSRRSAHDARRNLRLVHRGLRHRRPERRQGAARRVEP